MYNRLGAQNVNGIMYALRRDVVSKGSLTPCGAACVAGNVTLRPDKRPRPLVLRVAAGDCLEVKFQNLLTALANPSPVTPGFDLPKVDNQVASRTAGFHAQGMQLVDAIGDDSSWVGADGSSLVGHGRRPPPTTTSPRRRGRSSSPATARPSEATGRRATARTACSR